MSGTYNFDASILELETKQKILGIIMDLLDKLLAIDEFITHDEAEPEMKRILRKITNEILDIESPAITTERARKIVEKSLDKIDYFRNEISSIEDIPLDHVPWLVCNIQIKYTGIFIVIDDLTEKQKYEPINRVLNDYYDTYKVSLLCIYHFNKQS